MGMPLQMGVEIDIGRTVSLALLGEAGAGMGLPSLFEYNIGGMAELYFADKKVGLGFGIGHYGNMLPLSDYEDKESMYIRFELLLRNNNKKVGLFVQRYDENTLTFGMHFFGGWNLLR